MKRFHSQNKLEKKYRKLIVGLETKIPLSNGKKTEAIYFDNAATTPAFASVLQEINEYAAWYSSVHRGKGYKSVVSDKLLAEAREVVADFVHADKSEDAIIFTKNSTEAINLLTMIYKHAHQKPMILGTDMEHISNDLPWRESFEIEYVRTNSDGTLSLTDLESKLRRNRGKVKLVTVTGASNVTGFVNPVHKIARLAHQYDAKIHVDGAQSIPHIPFDMKGHHHPEHIDFLSFTGHKIYAPFGTGVLIGPKSIIDYATPLLKGGGSVRLVSRRFIQWDESPGKMEAGTPNMMGIVALKTSIHQLQKLNMKHLHEYENELFDYVVKGLKELPDIQLYGAKNLETPHISLLSFTMENMNHHDIAQILSDEYGISLRSGFFCAHPYIQRLLDIDEEEMRAMRENPAKVAPGLVRLSISFYNTKKEIDILLAALKNISSNKEAYSEKYKSNPKGACGRVPEFSLQKKAHTFHEV